MRRIFNCGLAGLALLAAGCVVTPPPLRCVSTFALPQVTANPPARIVVVPFDAPACTDGAGSLVTEAVALAAQDTFHVDVLMARAGDERLAAESSLWQRARVDVSTLIDARKEYLADAFLFGAVTQYKPYDPPLLGLKLRLLSAHTGEVLWAADGVFDARDRHVRAMALNYFRCSGLSEKLYGPELILVSPRQYSSFVAAEMFLPLKEEFCRLQAAATASAMK